MILSTAAYCFADQIKYSCYHKSRKLCECDGQTTYQAEQKKLDRELTKDRERLTKLQLEIGKNLTGESRYSADDLSQAIRTIKTRIGETEEKREGLRAEEEQER